MKMILKFSIEQRLEMISAQLLEMSAHYRRATVMARYNNLDSKYTTFRLHTCPNIVKAFQDS